MDESDPEFQTCLQWLALLEQQAHQILSELPRLDQLGQLRTIAAAQAARVTSEDPDQETKRRWAIVNDDIDNPQKQFRRDFETLFCGNAVRVFDRILPKLPERIAMLLAQLKEDVDPWRISDSCHAVIDGAKHVRRCVETLRPAEDTPIPEILLGMTDERMGEIKEKLRATADKDAYAAEEAARQARTEWLRYKRAQAQNLLLPGKSDSRVVNNLARKLQREGKTEQEIRMAVMPLIQQEDPQAPKERWDDRWRNSVQRELRRARKKKCRKVVRSRKS